MVSSIKNQRVGKRKHKSAVRVKTSPFAGIGFFERLNTYRIKRKVKNWFKSNQKKVSIYAASFFFLLFIGLFLSSSVPTAGSTLRKDSLLFPDENEIGTFLFNYLDGGTDGEDKKDEKDTTIPQYAVLHSLDPIQYTLRNGDTLSGIAARYNVDLGTLISFNNILDVRKIRAGSVLHIPRHDGVLYKVRSGDSLSAIAQRYGVNLNDILDVNNLDSSVIRVGQELFIPGGKISTYELKKATGQLFLYPVKGRLSSHFGMRNDPFTGVRRMHYGIDLANPVGTPVYASCDGTVAAVGFSLRSYGKYIIIKHQGGYQTLYGHLSAISVSNGKHVRQGQKIGEVGNTGRSTGPHLHFAIYKYQKPVDPLKYLF